MSSAEAPAKGIRKAYCTQSTFFSTPHFPLESQPSCVSHLGRLKQKLMKAVKPGTQGMQGTHTGYCIIQGPLGQELQLPIHTAKEVVHGHRVRPVEKSRIRQSELHRPQKWARETPQPCSLNIWGPLTSQKTRAEDSLAGGQPYLLLAIALHNGHPDLEALRDCNCRQGQCATSDWHSSPWPPRLQEGQQHLDPTDNDRLALLSLKHVTQKLLDGLLPGERGVKVKGQGPGLPQDSSPP